MSPAGSDNDKRAPGGFGAHGGEIGQVHRQRLPADIGRRGVVGKMDAAVEGIRRDHQLFAGRHLHDGGIVADAEDHIVADRGTAADALDQVELGGDSGSFGHDALQRATGCVRQRGRAACTSTGRHATAAWSSTPLT
jgi:hypothetical protein